MFDGKCSCSSQQLAAYLSPPLVNRGTVFPQCNFTALQTSPFLPSSNISNPDGCCVSKWKPLDSVSNAKSSKLPNKAQNQNRQLRQQLQLPGYQVSNLRMSNCLPIAAIQTHLLQVKFWIKTSRGLMVYGKSYTAVQKQGSALTLQACLFPLTEHRGRQIFTMKSTTRRQSAPLLANSWILPHIVQLFICCRFSLSTLSLTLSDCLAQTLTQSQLRKAEKRS